MPELTNALGAWNTVAFAETLRAELTALGLENIPLNDATSRGGLVDQDSISVMLLSTSEDEASLHLKLGVLFVELVPACNCLDDPTASNGYCEMRVRIDKSSAVTEFEIITD